jgi:hypothetical protein
VGINLDDYVDVAERIADFRAAYPEGTLQSECGFHEIDGRWWAVVKAYAYRTAGDVRPGVGLAYEVIPGKTPYTKDSELQNAETAAWGRAIIAVGSSDSKRGIASKQEVRNRQVPEPPNAEGRLALRALCNEKGWPPGGVAAAFKVKHDGLEAKDADNNTLKAFVSAVLNGLIELNFDSL